MVARVVLHPHANISRGIDQRKEPVRLQTFVPEPPVEQPRESVVGRRSAPREVQPAFVLVGPPAELHREKFQAIVALDRATCAAHSGEPSEESDIVTLYCTLCKL